MFLNNKNLRQKKRPFKTSTTYYRKVSKVKDINPPQPNLKRHQVDKRNLVESSVNTFSASSFLSIQLPKHSTINEENIMEEKSIGNVFSSDPSDLSDIQYDEEIVCDDQVFFEKQEEQVSFVEELRIWALSNKITHSATTSLLGLLRENGFSYLPKDSRTLLHTPSQIEGLQVMENGNYWYNGIENGLINILSQTKSPDNISLIINIDGIPIANSSKTEFWPILCSVAEISNMPILVVAVFCGEKKPLLNPFLEPFVREMSSILENGIFINGKKINVKIKCVVCDSPARAFIKGVVNFNSYNGCTRCTTIGEYENRRMSFPRIHCPLRTDENFRNRKDEEHHKEHTPFETLPIDMVNDFVVADSLHLLHLGIMKKLLIVWTTGKYTFNAKWSASDIKNISCLLVQCNENIPKEIHRSVRSLDCLSFWKGLEFRTFLLYVGPVILKDFLRSDIYEHFLMLFCAVTICSSKVHLNYVSVAEELCKDYIEKYIDIYGVDTITSNVHNFSHMVEDVIRFGPLPCFSSYRFENFLGYMKSLLRQGNRPLAQCAKRILEISKISASPIVKEMYPIAKEEIILKGPDHLKQFAKLVLAERLVISNKCKDKWFMTKQNEIVCMQYAISVHNEFKIYGSSITNKQMFFSKPINYYL